MNAVERIEAKKCLKLAAKECKHASVREIIEGCLDDTWERQAADLCRIAREKAPEMPEEDRHQEVADYLRWLAYKVAIG